MIDEVVISNDLVSAPEKALWKNAISEGIYAKEYWCGNVQCTTVDDIYVSNQQQVAILGYAVDEGVRRNGGRVGAKFAPNLVRKRLAKLPMHFSNKTILDVGTIHCPNEELEYSHEVLSGAVSRMLEKNVFPVVIGGGHDISYGHFKGIQQFLQGSEKKTIGILNFDAHFDLRSVDTVRNSGTPFYQIHQDLEEAGEAFHYCVLGIQQQSNMKTLFERADALGVSYLKSNVCTLQNFELVKQTLDAFLEKVDHVYLTIDLDAFASVYAPGVSAPSPFGLTPEFGVKVLEYLFASKKVISCDIAELNPTYDIDERSALLVARLIDVIVTQY